MPYYYPKSDPKWNKADHVWAASSDGSRVNVTIWQGLPNEQTFLDAPVGDHNRFGATDQNDVLVEDRDPSFGWRCIWFLRSAVEPYQETAKE